MPTVTVNQASLEYQWWGTPSPSRPPILLLHDALGSVKGWGEFPAKLASTRGCRVYAYSRQGFGGSEPLRDPLTADYVQREAFDVLPELRQALKLEDDLVLLGVHDGAAMALVHAASATQPVKAVLTVSPLVLVDEVTRSAVWSLTRAPPALAETAADQDRTVAEWASLWTSMDFVNWNIDDFLPGVACPVLLARGDKDEFTSPNHLAKLQKVLPDASAVTLPGCRHMPWVDKHGVLTQALDSFLALVR